RRQELSFRARLTLYVAAAIAVTVAAASVALWVVAEHQALTQFDRALVQQVAGGRGLGPFGHNTLIVTFVRPDGTSRGQAPSGHARARQSRSRTKRTGHCT